MPRSRVTKWTFYIRCCPRAPPRATETSTTASVSRQVTSVLDGARTNKSKWTTEAERQLLCEYWGRVARKAPRNFAFEGFSEEQVKEKLRSLRKILPDELLNLPQHIPAEELGETLASFKLLARKQGRAKVARSDLHGTMWAAASPQVLLPDEQARRTHLRVAPLHTLPHPLDSPA